MDCTEALHTGYRLMDGHHLTLLFPFGQGLSYTTFELSDLRLSTSEFRPDETVGVSLRVKNSGRRRGQQGVQVHVRDVQTTLDRPVKKLKAFRKGRRGQGYEAREFRVALDMHSQAHYAPTHLAGQTDVEVAV